MAEAPDTPRLFVVLSYDSRLAEGSSSFGLNKEGFDDAFHGEGEMDLAKTLRVLADQGIPSEGQNGNECNLEFIMSGFEGDPRLEAAYLRCLRAGEHPILLEVRFPELLITSY